MSATSLFPFKPATDGVDHINVYSRARTAGGRLLSNFTHTPFTLHGMRFASVEGFYQSLLFDDDATRTLLAGLHGAAAKRWEKKSFKREGDPIRTWDARVIAFWSEEFQEEVRHAMCAKVRQNPHGAAALLATGDLPPTHYHVMWGRPLLPRGERGLLVGALTALRAEFQEAEVSV
jgi:predicted NAD-dependent protein-ADP-ribosyltransferase YbiA (DUF1768 family)